MTTKCALLALHSTLIGWYTDISWNLLELEALHSSSLKGPTLIPEGVGRTTKGSPKKLVAPAEDTMKDISSILRLLYRHAIAFEPIWEGGGNFLKVFV